MRIECRKVFYRPILLIGLIALLLSSGACTNPEKAKAAHLSRGQAYLKESKFQEAAIEFRNALQIDDKLADAHWGLSQAYEGLQRLPESFEELRRTVELDANNLDAKVKLGNLYVVRSRPRPELIAEAEKLAKEVLQKNPNHIEAHILLGSVLFAQNQRDQALAELNRAIELDPNRVESYLSLARFYMSTQDGAKAEETFHRAIAINNNSALAHTEYGKYLVQLGKPVDAENELVKAVSVDPNDRNSRFVLASFYLVNKQLDKAEVAYKDLANLDKDKPESQAVLGDFYSLANRPDEGIKIYQEILAKSPDYVQGRYRLTEILMQSGRTQEARTQIDELLKKDEHNRQALLLRARVRLQTAENNEIKAAIDDLKEVLRQEPNSRAGLYFMAQANFNLGMTDQARVYLGELERNYPDYLAPKLMQMQISLVAGDPRTTIRMANEFLDVLNKTPADRENTPQLLADLRQKTYITRGAANVELQKFADARKDFSTVTEMSPDNSEAYNNLAVLSLAEKKPDEAVGFYEKALAINGTNTTALNGLIALYAQQQQLDKAHARIDGVLKSDPNNASLHFLKAQVYGYERNAQAAEAELRKALELDPNYINAYYSLASLFINTKQEERAIAEYRKILERRPDTSGAYTVIGMLEEARKNYDGAVENYRKALELDPNSAIAGNNLAWMYATQNRGNLDEAVRLAQAVVQKTTNVAGFVDTLGWVYFKKGLYAAAVEQLQKAVDLDSAAAKKNRVDPSPTYPFHLGMALKAKGDREAARHQLEVALRLGEKGTFNDAEEARKALATL
jgi:tetratricopeptide (TPR) repeat protein